MTRDKQLEVAVKALRDIVDPLAEIRAEAKAAGHVLDGAGCLGILESPNTYIRIAQRALRKMGRSEKWRP